MKKKLLVILLVVLLLALLAVPIPMGVYEDGGTREYAALTYKIVDWNRMTDDSVYDVTKVYFFPRNFRSVDDLWVEEEENVVHKVIATVMEMTTTDALIQPVVGQNELLSSDLISISLSELGDIGAEVGSVVEVYYKGGILETYPAQIHAIKWDFAGDLRHMEYVGEWLDKETAEKMGKDMFADIVITEAYADCFFAVPVIPMPHSIKLNGTLDEKWCVGDQVYVTYDNCYFDQETYRYEADVISVETSTLELDPMACYKPVIYLYPEEETQVSVALTLDGRLTCTYPAYQDGWDVTAMPDGTLYADGQTYNYLYWEGETNAVWDWSEGFCVEGADTAAFLEAALEKLGLTRREANEFIVYWLPLMQENPYNLISFRTDAYTDAAKLEIEPAPDTLIRVFMTWHASDIPVSIEPQELTAPQRTGFTAVEWGGAEVK